MPSQRRSRETVEVILDAVVRIVKRHGVNGVTTNRIAEAAGVSVGSIYQYFPDKLAIFAALHERHVVEAGRAVEHALVKHSTAGLEASVRALVDTVVACHAADPEVYELLEGAIRHDPRSRQAFQAQLGGTLRLALAANGHRPRDLATTLFVVTQMIDGLGHAVALQRPANVTRRAGTEAATRAIMAYLSSTSL